jgi:hypothetical protein
MKYIGGLFCGCSLKGMLLGIRIGSTHENVHKHTMAIIETWFCGKAEE